MDQGVDVLKDFHERHERNDSDRRAFRILRDMFDAAVSSANPANVLAGHLPSPPKGRCVVVGAGKAAASMAAAVETAWSHVNLSGVVVVPYGATVPTQHIRVLEARHPVPDAHSERAAREILEALKGLTRDDLVLALISGGGSSVLAHPAPGLTLEDKQAATRLLLTSGLDIKSINAIRRRISSIKGGRLAAAAAPARIITLAISDIPGDDIAAIASGPTVPDPNPAVDLSGFVAGLGPELPTAVARCMRAPVTNASRSDDVDFRLIATPRLALQAAAAVAQIAGFRPEILGDDLEGESRVVGESMAALTQNRCSDSVALISGGETTVTLAGKSYGKGGRNTEFLLALANSLQCPADVWALAADTDGEDGASGGPAGAFFGLNDMTRARNLGLDPAIYLHAHDSGSFFERLDNLIFTGPTRTNVNDFRAILIAPNGLGA